MTPAHATGVRLQALGLNVNSIRNADRSHVIASERTFFVTSSTWGKCGLLQSGRAAGLLIDVLYQYREQRKYLLHEFVIMPDHFHVVITVGAGMSVEKAVQFIKGGFSFRAGHELGFRGPVWQKGFSEIRVNEQEASLKIREYIHATPCSDCSRLQAQIIRTRRRIQDLGWIRRRGA